MLKGFYLSCFRYTLVPEERIILPRLNKGSVLRGAFGTSLKRLVCSMGRETSCDACILKDRCAYMLIFSPIQLTSIKRLRNQPRGYVLKPPLAEDTEYIPSSPLRFGMILIGDRIGYLPYVIVPIMELGRVGIGLNRGRFSLRCIESVKEERSTPIYDSSTNMVRNIGENITGEELMEKAAALDGGSVTLTFLTPARIKYNPTGEKGGSTIVRSPEFHHIIRRLRDRVNALSLTYCGRPIDADFKGLAERAAKVKTKTSGLRWIEIRRKSRTQGVMHDQSGFVGSITFEGDLREFLPLILAGEYVHVGEDAVFGNGWYRVE